ncbi:MAG: PRC-barrel domain-containing protein [Mariniblastus sp.]
MRKRFSDIKNTKLFTSDDKGLSPIGTVTDLLIEDESWNIRYLVALTDAPISRKVLISPAAILDFDFVSKSIATMLTKEQVVKCPPLDHDQPISRQYEQALVDYYGWPIYWFGRVLLKPQTLETIAADEATETVDESNNSNLRSANEICGYRIESQNGTAGYMKDLVVQVEAWTVDYATADCQAWLPKESSMFPTRWVNGLDWSRRKVQVDLSKTAIESTEDRRRSQNITGEPWSSQPFRTV